MERLTQFACISTANIWRSFLLVCSLPNGFNVYINLSGHEIFGIHVTKKWNRMDVLPLKMNLNREFWIRMLNESRKTNVRKKNYGSRSKHRVRLPLCNVYMFRFNAHCTHYQIAFGRSCTAGEIAIQEINMKIAVIILLYSILSEQKQ